MAAAIMIGRARCTKTGRAWIIHQRPDGTTYLERTNSTATNQEAQTPEHPTASHSTLAAVRRPVHKTNGVLSEAGPTGSD